MTQPYVESWVEKEMHWTACEPGYGCEWSLKVTAQGQLVLAHRFDPGEVTFAVRWRGEWEGSAGGVMTAAHAHARRQHAPLRELREMVWRL